MHFSEYTSLLMRSCQTQAHGVVGWRLESAPPLPGDIPAGWRMFLILRATEVELKRMKALIGGLHIICLLDMVQHVKRSNCLFELSAVSLLGMWDVYSMQLATIGVGSTASLAVSPSRTQLAGDMFWKAGEPFDIAT